jgi:hypothetical protein
MLEADQAPAPTQGEGLHLDAQALGGQEVPQLVDEHHDAETDQAEYDGEYHDWL